MNWTQHLVNGLVIGHAYALVAIGWTFLLGTARMVNFGHGQFYMFGAFMTWLAIDGFGWSYYAAVPFAIAVGALLGLAVQSVIMRLTVEQNLTSMMMVTLGVGLILEGLGGSIFGSNARQIRSPLNNVDFFLNDVWFTGRDVAVLVAAIIAFLLLRWALASTRVGSWVRMVAEDPALARLGGLRIASVYFGVFAFEGAAVALAAAVASPNLPIMTSMGFDELIMTFVVVVLGGVGSVTGSYVAAILLGLFTAFFGALVSPAYTTAAAFVVLIALLVLRPQGFGAPRMRGAH